MERLVRTCDRCGCELQEPKKILGAFPVHNEECKITIPKSAILDVKVIDEKVGNKGEVEILVTSGYSEKYYDLCEVCHRALIDFIEGTF